MNSLYCKGKTIWEGKFCMQATVYLDISLWFGLGSVFFLTNFIQLTNSWFQILSTDILKMYLKMTNWPCEQICFALKNKTQGQKTFFLHFIENKPKLKLQTSLNLNATGCILVMNWRSKVKLANLHRRQWSNYWQSS